MSALSVLLFEVAQAAADPAPVQDERALWRRILARLRGFAWRLVTENTTALILALLAFVRALGTTVNTGETGLLFRYGRAVRVAEPGFHYLIPFLWTMRVLPTRSRALDLPAQTVTTFEGLVYEVDASLVYRVVDVKKALIEIADLKQGMLQMLGLAIQEILRARQHGDLRRSDALDQELVARMGERLAPWGVIVERAGFTSIRPSRGSLRVTQLSSTTLERVRGLIALVRAGVAMPDALVLLGTDHMPALRARRASARESAGRARRLLRSRERRALARALPAERALRRRVQARLAAAKRRG